MAVGTWQLQRIKRSKGLYVQLVSPTPRRTFTLGFMTPEEYGRARENLTYWTSTPTGLNVIDALRRPEPPEDEGQALRVVRMMLVRDIHEVDTTVAAAVEAITRREVESEDYSNMTLEAFATFVWRPIRTSEVAENTIRTEFDWAWPIIFKTLGGLKIRSLDAPRWSRFMVGLEDLGGSSKVKIQNAYRCCLKYAVEIKAISEIHSFRPIVGAGKTVLDEKESLTVDEVARLLDAASNPMHRALYGTCFGLGLRPGEVVKLRWEYVQWTKGLIHIPGTKTKTAAAIIPLTGAAEAELRPYWESLGKPKEGWTFKWRGLPFEVWEFGFHKALKRAGLDKDGDGKKRRVVPTSGRVTFATLGVTSGIPDGAIRSMMRHTHKSVILERTYQKLKPEMTKGAVSPFPVFTRSSPDDAEE